MHSKIPQTKLVIDESHHFCHFLSWNEGGLSNKIGARLKVLHSEHMMIIIWLLSWVTPAPRNTKRRKYHCTVDLLFYWFEISCMTTGNFCFYFQNRLIQTSQTGGQWYSDASRFSNPCLYYKCSLLTYLQPLGAQLTTLEQPLNLCCLLQSSFMIV